MNCTPDASRQKNGKSIIKEKDLKYHFKKGKKQKAKRVLYRNIFLQGIKRAENLFR